MIINAHTESIQVNNAHIEAEDDSIKVRRESYEAQKWIYGTLLKRNGPLINALNVRTRQLLQEQIDQLTSSESFSIRVDDNLGISASFLGRDFKNYEKLSTGQERVCDIVMMVALNNLFTKLYGLDEGVLGLVIFDEVS